MVSGISQNLYMCKTSLQKYIKSSKVTGLVFRLEYSGYSSIEFKASLSYTVSSRLMEAM